MIIMKIISGIEVLACVLEAFARGPDCRNTLVDLYHKIIGGDDSRQMPKKEKKTVSRQCCHESVLRIQ